MKKGFTLIELLTVITVIIIVSGIMVFQLTDWRDYAVDQSIIAFEEELKSKMSLSVLSEWKMDEAESSVYLFDSGRQGNTASINNAAWAGQSNCIENDCLSFVTASSSYVDATDVQERTFKTFCAWVRTTSENVTNFITKTDNGTQTAGDFNFYLSAKKPGISAYYYDGAVKSINILAYSSTPAEVEINDDGWHYVCGSIDSGEVSIYLDGEFRGSNACSACTAENFGGNDHHIYFGRGYSSGWVYNTFYLDDVVLYEDSLDFSKIKDFYLKELALR